MSLVFKPVWYLAHENRWRDRNPLAYHDVGTLTLSHGTARFKGHVADIHITDIRHATCVKQGRDFVNRWVKIEFGEAEVAYLADAGWMGWRGIFGGTRRIWRAMRQLQRIQMHR